MYRPHKNGVDDLVLLKELSNESIGDTLKQHFAADEIYVRRTRRAWGRAWGQGVGAEREGEGEREREGERGERERGRVCEPPVPG